MHVNRYVVVVVVTVTAVDVFPCITVTLQHIYSYACISIGFCLYTVKLATPSWRGLVMVMLFAIAVTLAVAVAIADHDPSIRKQSDGIGNVPNTHIRVTRNVWKWCRSDGAFKRTT